MVEKHTLHYLRSSATITDAQWVLGIAALRRPIPITGGFYWVNVGEMADLLNIHPNRIRSKMRRAKKRKLSDGCNCGCRGDIELLPAGEKLMRETLERFKNYGRNTH